MPGERIFQRKVFKPGRQKGAEESSGRRQREKVMN